MAVTVLVPAVESPRAPRKTRARATTSSHRAASAPLDADLLELYVLADRAQLWASIAPGLGHHLANALMSLGAPRQEPEALGHLTSRLERAHQVLSGMSDAGRTAWPVCPASVLADVDAWHRLQLTLPSADFHIDCAADVPVVDGGTTRLHHALLALVTLAKESGAPRITIAVRREGDRAAFELQLPSSPAGMPPGARARRLQVVEHLVGSIGGWVEREVWGDGERVKLILSPWEQRAR